jgi:hydrogenase-4 component B
MSWLFAAGLALLIAAAAADLAAGRGRGLVSGVPYLAGAAGSVCLAAAGGCAAAGHTVTLAVGGWLGQAVPGQQTLGLSADRLSGFFLAMALGAAVPVSLAFASWAARHGAAGSRPGLGWRYALTLGAVAVVVTARDVFTFLIAWESLTLAFYLLSGFGRDRPGRSGAAQVTLTFGKVSGFALLAGMLLLAGASHSVVLASFTRVPGGAVRTAAMVLLLGGFAVKAGLVPFHVWLPRGYSAAPGPARAVMAGVAVNVAFYGMWRTLALLGRPPGWLAGTLLILGALSALLGIAHAAVQNRLPRVIAYSSVENSGLIVVGFAVALTGAAVRDQRLVAAGLLAATLQMVTHTAAKSLLFTASAGLEAGAAGLDAGGPGAAADDLDVLRGMARRAPWSGTGLAVGSMTLAGLPVTAGFVSEWFLLEALMQQFRVPGLGYRIVLALAGAAVALTAGFAGVAFVRVVGFVVLGGSHRDERPAARAAGNGSAQGTAAAGDARPRGYGGHSGPGRRGSPGSGVPGSRRHGDGLPGYGWAGRAAVAFLAVCCPALAALTPLEIRAAAAGLSPVVPRTVTAGALKSPWVVQPVFANFSILSPSWLWIAIPVLALLVASFTWAVSGRRMLRVRRVPAWRSATIGVEGAGSYTAFGYANPTRRVLAAVLHTRTEVRPVETGINGRGEEREAMLAGAGEAIGAPAAGRESAGVSAGDAAGSNVRSGRRDDRTPDGTAVPHLEFASDVIEVVEEYLYRPVLRPAAALVRATQRLQSGRLDAYLAYMLIALIAVIAVATALA